MSNIKTYRQLLAALQQLDDKQLECNLTIFDANEEYVPVKVKLEFEQDDDVLDKGHPWISIKSHVLEEVEE